MSNLIIATFLPALIVLTSFLFNLGNSEIVDMKYGINKRDFKPIACIVFVIYTMTVLLKKLMLDSNDERLIRLGITIIILVVIYLIAHYLFRKERDKILKKSSRYESYEKKRYLLFTISLLLIIFSSFITFIMFEENLIDVYKALVPNLKIDKITSSTNVVTIFALLLIYSITILSSGYLFAYGQLHGFKKYKITFKDASGILNTKEDEIHAYIIADTEESVVVKIDGEDKPARVIKRELISSVMFIDENQDVDTNGNEKQFLTKIKLLKNHAKWKVALIIGVILGMVVKLTTFGFENYTVGHKEKFTGLTISPKVSEFIISTIITIFIVIIYEVTKNKKLKETIIKIIKKCVLFIIFFIIGIFISEYLTKLILKVINIARLTGLILGIMIGKWLINILKNEEKNPKDGI